MDKNRYDTRKRRDSGGIPPYMKIEGSDAFSCIRSGMGPATTAEHFKDLEKAIVYLERYINGDLSHG